VALNIDSAIVEREEEEEEKRGHGLYIARVCLPFYIFVLFFLCSDAHEKQEISSFFYVVVVMILATYSELSSG
jgi:hypothetical protein